MTLSSVTALAETKVKFSGFYKIFHENNVNFTRSADGNNQDSDSYFWHRLQLTIDFTPNENLNVRWVLRAPTGVRWGRVGYGRDGNRGAERTGYPYDVFTRAIYATINSDYGKFTIGRHNGGLVGNLAGLETLGYGPKYGDYLNNHVFDWNLPFDGITYQKKWDNGFGINVVYVKENGFDEVSSYANSEKDVDKDRFGVEPFYLWDGGGASVNFEYSRDHSRYNSYSFTNIQNNVTYTYTHPVDKNWSFSVNPAVFFTVGDFSFHFEGKAAWSETVYKRDANISPAGGQPRRLVETKKKDVGLGLYADAVYKYGPGAITLGAWYFDGDDLDEGNSHLPNRKKGHSLVGAGSFSPFLVAYAANGLAGPGTRANNLGDPRSASPNKYLVGNHWALALFGDHSFTKDVKIHFGLGYFRLVNPRDTHQVNGRDVENSKELGYEFDLGVIAKLLDNVSFESHFGYFVNGDAFKDYDTGQKAKNTYAWANALIFTF
jgi:hypothetical protein